MKKIFLSLLAIVLYSGSLSAQTLMSDEEHRIMMNDFAIQLNNTLTNNCPPASASILLVPANKCK